MLFSIQLREETASLRSELDLKSKSLQKALSFNENMLKKNSEQLSQAEEEKGSAEHTIQAQKATIERLQQEVSVVSVVGRVMNKDRARDGGILFFC